MFKTSAKPEICFVLHSDVWRIGLKPRSIVTAGLRAGETKDDILASKYAIQFILFKPYINHISVVYDGDAGVYLLMPTTTTLPLYCIFELARRHGEITDNTRTQYAVFQKDMYSKMGKLKAGDDYVGVFQGFYGIGEADIGKPEIRILAEEKNGTAIWLDINGMPSKDVINLTDWLQNADNKIEVATNYDHWLKLMAKTYQEGEAGFREGFDSGKTLKKVFDLVSSERGRITGETKKDYDNMLPFLVDPESVYPEYKDFRRIVWPRILPPTAESVGLVAPQLIPNPVLHEAVSSVPERAQSPAQSNGRASERKPAEVRGRAPARAPKSPMPDEEATSRFACLFEKYAGPNSRGEWQRKRTTL